jgi:plasmid stability protein
MATLTIRNLDEKVKRRLQIRAVLNDRSMEAEVRALLTSSVEDPPAAGGVKEDLGAAIHGRLAAIGGVDLMIPPIRHSRIQVAGVPMNPAENLALKEGLGTAIHSLFAPLGGVDLQIPPRRKSHRQISTFE